MIATDNMSIDIIINNTIKHGNSVYPETTDLSQVDYPGVIKYTPMWEIVVKTFFYIPVIIFGIIGNAIVIAVVAKNKRMQTTTNYYIVNLAVADCLIALTCSWSHLVDDLTPFSMLGKFFCPFNTFSQGSIASMGGGVSAHIFLYRHVTWKMMWLDLAVFYFPDYYFRI